MAFYSEENLNYNRQLSEADLEVGFADYLGATIRDAWHDNPTVATIELGEVYTAQVGRDAIADIMGDSFDTETDVSEFEPTASPALSLEDQQVIIRENGLEKHIKAQEGYNAEALNLVMESKREELERQVTRQAASDWYAPAGFIAGLGTSFLDPINVASNFIPGVGQTRALRMLQEGAKQGAKGLALRRAAIGAAEGAVGSVVVEPLVAFARSQQQADYGMTDSLLNVAFGTVMGATLHPALGAWGDYKRRQAQKNNPLITAPWEVVPPTDKTEALRHQFAQDALAKAREAGASMTEEQAYASAALFDARARTVAYFENIDPEEYYKQHRPEFEAAIEAAGSSPDTLFQFLGERGAARLDEADEASTRMDNLTVAREMETSGKDAAAIKRATGWERGADGKWRYEIGDTLLSPEWVERQVGYYEDPNKARLLTDDLASVLPKEIMDAYPALSRVQLMIYLDPKHEGTGSFTPEVPEDDYSFGRWAEITIEARTVEEAERVLQHELQHFIQEQEGFAQGGNLGSSGDLLHEVADILGVEPGSQYYTIDSMAGVIEHGFVSQEVYAQIKAIGQKHGYDDPGEYIRSLSPRRYYDRLAGEVEARNADSRYGMSAEERLASPAYRTEDVAREQQIVLMDAIGKAEALQDPDAVAYLPEEKARMMGLPGGGKFIARASDLEPVDRKHGKHFKDSGFENALEMVRYVLDDVQAVYPGGGNTFLFVRELDDPKGKKGTVAAEFEVVIEGKQYRVTTVTPMRKDFYKNKTPLWERAQSNHSTTGTPSAVSGQSGVSEANIPQPSGDINTLLQRAWHGTPHDFDAFTLQAIGSGEGAQAHGWGLYFAKNKTTAKRYKTGLSKGKGGRLFEVDIPENNVLLDEQKAFSDQHKNVQKLILEAIQAMSESEQDVFYKRILGSKLDDSEAYNKATAKLDRERLFLKAITGISDSKFVRIWHRKTLLERGYSEEQIDELWADTEKAKAEIQKFLPEVQRLEAEQKALKQKDDERRASFLSEAKSNPEATLAKVFGEQLYDAIAWAVSKENYPDFRAASEALNAAGIKGITYEGGRDGRCFVVFDDKAIQILDKLYQIIGEKGAARLDRAREETVRTDNLAVAVKMAAEGKDDITIRLATGWEQGVDGKWRYEIPDGRLDFSGLKGKVQRDRYTPKGAHRAARLKDVLIMPDLYAAYPEIANIRVFTQTLPRQEHAAVLVYSDDTKVIVLNSRYAKPGKPTEAILSNIVHEVQHVIQSAEGFIQGSSPKKAGDFERYEQVAGEAEARNAEGRIGFSEEERRNFLLSSTSDVSAGDMRTPDGKPLRDPRLPVEPVGPLIGREPRHALPEELPDDYDLGLPPEIPDAETPRGAVTFRPEDGKAVITFFKNTDASTLPHEMFHIFRRELAETAGMEGSSPQSKDMWAKVCEFVGAKEGEKWTVEQEEMFARAGERYLLEGKAPNAQLRGVFERMKQWFMEIYTSVDAAGMEISDTMRQVFGDMFKLSPEEADMAFRYGFGKMLEWDGSEGTDTAIPELPESDDPAMQEELTGLAQQRLEESLQSVADMPEVADAVRAEIEQELAALDEAMTQDKIQGEVLLEAALCDMRN